MKFAIARTVSAGAAIGFAVVAVLAGTAMAQAPIYVPSEPPPLRQEVVPVLPPDRAAVDLWQPGYWRWNGQEYVWMEGHYAARPRTGAVWVPGHWEHRELGWVFVDGHWG
jgi:hypothetical protein